MALGAHCLAATVGRNSPSLLTHCLATAAAPGVGVRHLGRGCRAPRRPRLAHVAHTRVSPARLYGSERRRSSSCSLSLQSFMLIHRRCRALGIRRVALSGQWPHPAPGSSCRASAGGDGRGKELLHQEQLLLPDAEEGGVLMCHTGAATAGGQTH